MTKQKQEVSVFDNESSLPSNTVFKHASAVCLCVCAVGGWRGR